MYYPYGQCEHIALHAQIAQEEAQIDDSKQNIYFWALSENFSAITPPRYLGVVRVVRAAYIDRCRIFLTSNFGGHCSIPCVRFHTKFGSQGPGLFCMPNAANRLLPKSTRDRSSTQKTRFAKLGVSKTWLPRHRNYQKAIGIHTGMNFLSFIFNSMWSKAQHRKCFLVTARCQAVFRLFCLCQSKIRILSDICLSWDKNSPFHKVSFYLVRAEKNSPQPTCLQLPRIREEKHADTLWD